MFGRYLGPIGSVTAWHSSTRALGISQTLWHDTRNGITELSLFVIFNGGRHLHNFEGDRHVGHRPTFCISSIPSLPLNSLLWTLSFTLTLHIHLTILISARWSGTSFSFLTGQVSLPCSILLRAQLLYSLSLLINDITLLVSNGTNCLNLFHPIRILASTAASTSPSTLNISPR